jgi:nucleotide-binding universal stress UspA family protein
MVKRALLCTDGSDVSISALRSGLAVVGPDTEPVLVTVIEPPDPSLLTGTGMAGGTVSPEVYTALEQERRLEGAAIVERAADALGLSGARTAVLEGRAGDALCTFAEGEDVTVIVMGTRGRGGLQRAVLGSVSDHVVRHAPCPVVVARPDSA